MASAFTTLGLLAGVGDAAGEHNRRRAQQEEAAKAAFAGDLQRIMESEDWPEQARMTAAQARYQLLSGGVKAKDYEKLWNAVHEASGRPGAEAPEVAAARSDMPALQHMQKTLPAAAPIAAPQTGAPVQNNALGLLAPSVANEQGQNVFGPTQETFGLKSQTPTQNTVLQPPSFGQAVDTQAKQAQNIVSAAPPPPVVYGPTTRAEKNQQAMDAFKEQLRVQQQFGLETFEKEQEIRNRYAPTTVEKNWQPLAKGSRVLYHPQTGEIRQLDLPDTEDPAADMTIEERYVDAELRKIKAAGGNPDDPNQFQGAVERAKARLAASGRNPDTAAMMSVAQGGTQAWREFQAKMALRQDQAAFTTAYEKKMNDAQAARQHVFKLREALASTSIGGDVAAIYSAMRALDPSSVVREQEYKTGATIGSYLDQLRAKYANFVGTGKLSPGMRKEFVRIAEILDRGVAQAEQAINDRFMARADALGYDFDQIGFSGKHTYIPGTKRKAAPTFGGRSAAGPPGIEDAQFDAALQQLLGNQ